MPHAAFAMPAFSGMHITTQPDGTQVSYCIHGDENFSYFTAEDGSLLQRDPETGALHYVIDNGDGTLSLGAQANSAAPLAQDARSNDLATAEALSSDGARDAYQALEGISGRSVDVTPSFPLLTRNTANPLSLDQDVIQLPESIPLLTIVVGFSDGPYRDDYDWTREMFTGQYSTSKFWSDASNDTFTFSAAPETSAQGAGGNTNQYDKENDGVVHVSLDMPHGNWGGFETDEQMESMVEMFVAAFEAADAYVDFSAFDKNGDAKLTTDELALCFVIAGRETSFDEDNNHSIWAHAWSTSSASELFGKDYSFVADGISTSDYIAMGESQGYRGQALVQNSTTTLTHELRHYLGLPDLYDTTNETGNAWSDWKAFGLSIMDYGSWGSNIPITSDNYTEVTWIPTRLDPLCSYLLGFTSPIEISEAGAYDVQASRTDAGYQSYVIQAPGTDDQFYFVENRLPEGFDKGLCGIYGDKNGNGVEGGIVVWHFDATVWDENTWNNTVNVATHRPAIMPVYVEFANDNGDIRPNIWYGFRTLSFIEDLASTDCIDDRLKRYSATEPDNPDAREASGVSVFALTDAQDLATFELAFSDTAQDDGDGLTVLFTNDVHGAGLDPTSDGLTYASVAALEKDARIAAGSGNVTLVDAGDAVQGNAIATLSEGDIPLQAMLESGYDLMVPGNHKFDYGTDRLLELAQQAEAGGAFYLATNIRNSITDEPLLHLGSMQTYLQDGEPIVVAFIGIATPETLTKSRPSNFQDENGTTYVDFYGDETGEALYDRVQSMVDKARKDGADYVVAVGHLGNQGVTPRWSSKEVIANTSGIDVLIDGHSHEQENEHVANAQGDDVLLVQTGTQLSNVGKLTLGENGFDAEFITADDYVKKDAGVTAVLEGYQEEISPLPGITPLCLLQLR